MPDNVNLSFLLNMPPEKAVEYLRQKGYSFSFNWHEVWQEAHHKAFTVAKAMNLDVLSDIRSEVQKAIDNGTTLNQFQKNLEPTLNKKGWWGKSYMFDNEGNFVPVQLGSPERLQTIYQTNLTVAYATGRYQEQIENVKHRPYWQYLAVMDENTRDEHAAMNGKVFRWDHPFWQSYYPPNDWGCRCHVRALTEADLKREGLTVEEDLPEGFDPKKFAPEEWSYNPGATNIGLDDSAWSKIRDVEDKDLRRQAVETFCNLPGRKEVFSNFVDNVLTDKLPRGISQVAGWMDNDVIAYIEDNFKKLTTPIITIRDNEILHLSRDTKSTKGTSLTPEEIKAIPDVLQDPQAVLWDTQDPALLYITTNESKSQKILIRVEYKIKGSISNLIKTAGKVQINNLKDPRYKVVKGKL